LLQIRETGPYPHEFSLNSPAIRLKFMNIWSRFHEFSLRFSKSDRLLVILSRADTVFHIRSG
ncbi:MAG: hypothetical protein KKD63_09325, partial [Proteobacteria bacterium]|nr:hypothetical protein [Pseudomonadota bacterium]